MASWVKKLISQATYQDLPETELENEPVPREVHLGLLLCKAMCISLLYSFSLRALCMIFFYSLLICTIPTQFYTCLWIHCSLLT